MGLDQAFRLSSILLVATSFTSLALAIALPPWLLVLASGAFVLAFLRMCASLAPPVFAQDQQRPEKNELSQAPKLKSWTGDLDGMVERRIIRALVAPSRTSYWVNGARQTGAEYELLKAFQEEINNHYKAKGKHILIHELGRIG